MKTIKIFRDLEYVDKTYLLYNLYSNNDPDYHVDEIASLVSLPVVATFPVEPRLREFQTDGVPLWTRGGLKMFKGLEGVAQRVLLQSFGSDGEGRRTHSPSLMRGIFGRSR
jgi:hypothetical protein